ncbi:uncharacterized protein LOC134811906 isoform X1 [Bolinopsis microptera]|uniref:uncharacterized protein LOC134811906 isoform X1 n=1 Tax=Bolinopsis microptera TaxID=2820187 RepID=UPI00307ACCAB
MSNETEKRGIEAVSGGSGETGSVKRKRYNDIRFRLLFHQDSVGRVIGRNGENLKHARQDISAKAHLRVPEFPSSIHNKDRILMVSCELTDVPRLLEKLAPSLWHALEGRPQREFNLLVPSDIAGAVLGKGGSTLKDLREKYGCKVKMHKDKLPYSDERVLEIPGRDNQIDAMIETLVAVLTILQEKPLLHDYIRYTPYVCKDEDYSVQCGGYMKGFLEKGGDPGKLALTVRPDGQLTGHRNADMDRSMSYNYSSSTDITAFTRQSTDTGFDNSYNTPNPFAAQTYAGAKQMMSDMGQYTHNPLPTLPTLDQSASYSSLPQMENYRRMPLPTSPPRHSSPPRTRSPPRSHTPPRARSPPRSVGFRQDERRADRSPPPRMIVDDFMNEEISKDIQVDDSLTSSIIGPRGSRISSVRKKTSAIIKIADDNSVVDGTRKITISGTMKEVMWAFNAVKGLILDADEEVRRSSGQREPQEQSAPQPLPNSNKLFEMAQNLIPFETSTDGSDERTTKEIKIPNKNAGMVLGRKASIINEIRSFSNCKINVAKDSEVDGDQRTVQITGSSRDVHLAEYLITAVQQMPRDTPQILGLV